MIKDSRCVAHITGTERDRLFYIRPDTLLRIVDKNCRARAKDLGENDAHSLADEVIDRPNIIQSLACIGM